jgi:uncharacterized protein with GYD domain
MTLYVLLTNLTDEGRKTIKERPERIREVNQEIADMGVTVIAQMRFSVPMTLSTL